MFTVPQVKTIKKVKILDNFQNAKELYPTAEQVVLKQGMMNVFKNWLIQQCVIPTTSQIVKTPRIPDTFENTSDQETTYKQKGQESPINLYDLKGREINMNYSELDSVISSKRSETNEQNEIEFSDCIVKKTNSCLSIESFDEKKQELEFASKNSVIKMGGINLQTKVITSSQSIRKNKELLKKFFSVDNLVEKEQEEQKLEQKERAIMKGRVEKNRVISLVYQLLKLKKIACSIGTTNLRGIFILSTLEFLRQFYLSKNLLIEKRNILLIIFEIILFLISASSYSLLVYKSEQNKRKRNC